MSLLCLKATAQQYAFQITFTDKNNSPYRFSDSLAYLSPRALVRRVNQHIAMDSTDLPVNPLYVDSVLSLTGGKFHENSRWLNMCIILLEDVDSAQIAHLAGKSFISDVKLVGTYTFDLHRGGGNTHQSASMPAMQRTTNSDDIYYGDTWTQTHQVNGNYLSDNGYKGQNKLIAVLDAGFIGADSHSGFDSLRMSGRLVDQYNFVTDNSGVFISDDHGTQVLSTMAGYVPDTFVGSAPLAMYALYVTEIDVNDQPLELDNMIAGAERADSIGADIITESLGYDLFLNPADGENFNTDMDGKTTVAARAANIATKKGMLFVATAGNDGSPPVPGYGDHILTPGDADSALTIGAVDYTGAPAAFSGYGPNAAGRTKPDVSALGVNAAVFNAAGGYGADNGTSFSTPEIAGWAACLWQTTPLATPYQLRKAIIQCASAYTSPGPQIGYGVPNFECTAEALSLLDTLFAFSSAEWVFATPNPFTDQLKISASPAMAGNVRFQLFDIAGKVMTDTQQYLYQGYNAPVYISIPALPVGTYMLRVASASQIQTLKLEKR
jgi:hypothetical protein